MCGSKYTDCDSFYLINYSKRTGGCVFDTIEENEKFTLKKWILSIIDPNEFGQDSVKIVLSQNFTERCI